MYGEYKKLEYSQKIGDMHRSRWKEGDWTDDSDQMILIMESLLEHKKVERKGKGRRRKKGERVG